jgi:hypothetical protein
MKIDGQALQRLANVLLSNAVRLRSFLITHQTFIIVIHTDSQDSEAYVLRNRC